MKNFSIFVSGLFCVLSSAPAFALSDGTYICNSKDFDANTYTGQSLKLSFNQSILVRAQKLPGSWFGDSGVVENPKAVASHLKAKVYAVDFKNDDLHGRIIVNASGAITYSFGYMGDDSAHTSTDLLNCRSVAR